MSGFEDTRLPSLVCQTVNMKRWDDSWVMKLGNGPYDTVIQFDMQVVKCHTWDAVFRLQISDGCLVVVISACQDDVSQQLDFFCCFSNIERVDIRGL